MALIWSIASCSAWIEPVSEIAIVPVDECSWPTITSVSVTARWVVLTADVGGAAAWPRAGRPATDRAPMACRTWRRCRPAASGWEGADGFFMRHSIRKGEPGNTCVRCGQHLVTTALRLGRAPQMTHTSINVVGRAAPSEYGSCVCTGIEPEITGKMRAHEKRTTKNLSHPPRLQLLGGQRDPGGLRAALHAAQRTQMERNPRGEHGAGGHVLPGAGGHRRRDRAELRLRQCPVGHPGHGPDHLPHRAADRHLRRPLRAGHGPAHARRRLRLPGLHRHLADLRQLHLHLLCAGGGHHGAGPADGAGLAAGVVLRAVVAGHHAHGAARHHLHLAPADLDPAAVGGPAAVALLLVCRGAARAVSPVHRPLGPELGQQRVRAADVRRRRRGDLLAGGADRRTGGLPAFHAGAHATPTAGAGGAACWWPARAGSCWACSRCWAAPSWPSSRCSTALRHRMRASRRRCTSSATCVRSATRRWPRCSPCCSWWCRRSRSTSPTPMPARSPGPTSSPASRAATRAAWSGWSSTSSSPRC